MPRKGGTKTIQFRATMKAQWQPRNAPCGICGQATIDWDGPQNAPDSFELDHKHSFLNFPELEFDPGNAQPSHCRCNRNKQAGKGPAQAGTTSEPW